MEQLKKLAGYQKIGSSSESIRTNEYLASQGLSLMRTNLSEENGSPGSLMTQMAGADKDVDPSLTDFFNMPLGPMTQTLAGPAVAGKRKRDIKNERDPVSSSAPRKELPYIERQKAKKAKFRQYYKCVKPGGCYRHMIEAEGEGLTQDQIKLLDEQLKLYVCLTSDIILKDVNGKHVKDQDG
jgi:hypothetical protein